MTRSSLKPDWARSTPARAKSRLRTAAAARTGFRGFACLNEVCMAVLHVRIVLGDGLSLHNSWSGEAGGGDSDCGDGGGFGAKDAWAEGYGLPFVVGEEGDLFGGPAAFGAYGYGVGELRV